MEVGARPVRPPRKLYKIGEVMEFSGLSRQTIHNYTHMKLISESERTPSGHRLYAEDVFEQLRRIDELKKTKTLKEIRRILRKHGATRKSGPTDSHKYLSPPSVYAHWRTSKGPAP